MFNCKPGDIAVITWDEALVFSNVGKLVKVGLDAGYDPRYGLKWFIEPVNYADNYLFIDGRADDAIKVCKPGDYGIEHPDEWMRPLNGAQDSCEEFIQKIIKEAQKSDRQQELMTADCS